MIEDEIIAYLPMTMEQARHIAMMVKDVRVDDYSHVKLYKRDGQLGDWKPYRTFAADVSVIEKKLASCADVDQTDQYKYECYDEDQQSIGIMYYTSPTLFDR